MQIPWLPCDQPIHIRTFVPALADFSICCANPKKFVAFPGSFQRIQHRPNNADPIPMQMLSSLVSMVFVYFHFTYDSVFAGNMWLGTRWTNGWITITIVSCCSSNNNATQNCNGICENHSYTEHPESHHFQFSFFIHFFSYSLIIRTTIMMKILVLSSLLWSKLSNFVENSLNFS